MVRIPGGSFVMGGGLDLRAMKNIPMHRVDLAYFYIDRFEVTVDAYRKCAGAGACNASELDLLDRGEKIPYKSLGGSVTDAFPLPPDRCTWSTSDNDSLPINCVTWSEAHTYCKWSGKRLPTAAEWEKAARGTDGRTFPWGNTAPTCDFAVMDDGGSGCNTGGPLPVGSRPKGASPYGALDMQGNLAEWVEDAYDPLGFWLNWHNWDFWRRDKYSLGYGPNRILLGGDYTNSAMNLRHINDRLDDPPGAREYVLGFRCAY